MARVDIERARTAKAKLLKRLRELEISAGVGLTQSGDDYALKVNLTDTPDAPLPDQIDGVAIISEVVGRIRKQAG